ncbi:MAG: FKBP-type peptidyl-prolyl cis-trans isomerase [Patescibacteria group bacterium]|nr:FKBP-type peptidyl-prolyl cis-trans isomerase [Patescibacteria group bacterium]
MAGKRDRAFALFGAGLFLLTSSALTIAIVVQNISANKDKKAAEAKIKSSQTTKPTNTKETKVNDSTKLKGTQLANFTPIPKIEKLTSEDTTAGTGQEVKKDATLTVDYTGAVASTGKVFESSKDSGQKATFPLNRVIKGWQDGIPGMKVGGTRRLFIPAAQAYGSASPSADIPANSDLVFDVTVHEAK